MRPFVPELQRIASVYAIANRHRSVDITHNKSVAVITLYVCARSLALPVFGFVTPTQWGGQVLVL